MQTNTYAKIKNSFIILIIVLTFSVVGYMIIEKWSFIDAFYMTIITLTTVGFGEINPLCLIGKIHTIIIVLAGVGFGLYFITILTEFVVSMEIQKIMGRRKLDKQISKLKNHYIVCGYGKVGSVLSQNIMDRVGGEIVVAEKDTELIKDIEAVGLKYVVGDSTEEETLEKAGIKRAKYLVATLGKDVDNVYLVLTAKTLNPDIFIMARASSIEAKKKLRAAGATRVESPYDIGAHSMALRILRPLVHKFMNTTLNDKKKGGSVMEEIIIGEASIYVEKKIKDIDLKNKYNALIITIKKVDKEDTFSPSADYVLTAGDTLVVVAPAKNIVAIKKALYP